MSLKKLDEFAVISVLLHGGHILQKRPILFGQCQYLVLCPDQCRDVVLGYVTEGTVCKLWDFGLIIGKDVLKQEDDYILNSFVMKKSTLNELFNSLKINKTMEE